MSHQSDDDDRLIPDPQVCLRYQVSAMTLWRWDRDPELGFPKPFRIRNRKYRKLGDLRAFDRARMAASEVA